MDPNANLEQQLELAREITDIADTSDGESWDDTDPQLLAYVARRAQMLTELVTALHEWITKGGALPTVWGEVSLADDGATRVQGIELALRLKKRQGHTVVSMCANGNLWGLPDGYLHAQFEDGFECGIAPDGSVSS